MNLPDKIEINKVDENGMIKLYLTPTDKAINQLIDCIAEDRKRLNDYLESKEAVKYPKQEITYTCESEHKNDN